MQEKTKGAGKIASVKAVMAVLTFAMLFAANGFYSYAGAKDIGKNAGNWMLDQIFWVALIVIAIILAGCLMNKAWIKAAITIIGGAVILVFIKNPQMLSNIGETLVHDVLGL